MFLVGVAFQLGKLPISSASIEKAIELNGVQVEKNIDVSLTENFALNPASSICGLYFFNPQSRYFNLGKINLEQFNLYCETKNYSKDKLKSLLQGNLVE